MSDIQSFLAKQCKESRNILSLIQKHGPLTKNDLIVLTDLKLTTLNRLIEPLEEKKLIVTVGTGESALGRKPVLYDINKTDFFIIGIDLSRTYVQLVLTDLKLNIRRERRLIMDESCSPQVTIRHISEMFWDILTESEITPERILGIGAGTVGPLDLKKGVMTHPYNFSAPDWTNVPLKDMLAEEFKLPVFVDNGANTALLAESLFGDGKRFQNIVYIHCGVGIRTGAMSAGTIVRTVNGAEDAFGHMVVDFDGEPCYCGNFGCIECYTTIPVIKKKLITEIKKGRRTVITKPVGEIGFSDICEATENGDELSKEIISDAATVFGIGLANYVNLLSPGLVILSGPIISNSALFYDTCTDVALKKSYSRSAKEIVFSRGRFGDNAIAAGAAALVFENLLRTVLC